MSGDHFSSEGYASSEFRREARERQDYQKGKTIKTIMAFIKFMEGKDFVLFDSKPLSEEKISELVHEFIKGYARQL